MIISQEKKETIIGISAIIGIIIVVIFGLYYIFSWSDKNNKEFKVKNNNEIIECIEKTNDLDWCLKKFN